MITDSCESDNRGFSERRPGKSLTSTLPGKMPMVFVVLFLMVSSVSLLVGLSVGGESHDPEPGIELTVMATGTPPTFVIGLPADINVNEKEPKLFYVSVQDLDNDTLNVTWDFGDGTPLVVNTTLPAEVRQAVRITHLYDPYCPGRGEFQVNLTLNVSLDDGNGNIVYRKSTIHVNMLRNAAPSSLDLSGPLDIIEPTDIVTIYANTSDPDGDELWWLFIFNNSGGTYRVEHVHTDRTAENESVTVEFALNFEADGYYNVTVYLSDAPEQYQVFPHNISARLSPFIHVVTNRAPIAGTSITPEPQTPIINATVGYIEVRYKVDAFDPDGDIFTVTWNFGDGTDNVTNESAAGTAVQHFYQVRNYTDAGDFNITALVTDGRPGHDTLLNMTMTVMSTNRAPEAMLLPFKYWTGDYAVPPETLNFTIIFSDAERDPIEVIVDWGDNSTLEFYNLTAFDDKNITLILSHTYTHAGAFNLTILYTDNRLGLFNHSRNLTNLVTVKVPPIVIVYRWSWWDFTSFALFCMIPGGAIARFYQVSRQRKKLELEGLTLEEWKLVRSEMGEDALKKGEL